MKKTIRGEKVMEVQVRLSYKTALMLEQLKEYYEKSMGVTLTKSDVLSKAIMETFNLWDETDWRELEIDVQQCEITQSSLRPRLQISDDNEEKINYLRKSISIYLGMQKFITLGVAIKYIFELALSQIQFSSEMSMNEILFETLKEYLVKDYSEKEKKILSNFVDEVLLKYDNR